MSNGALTKTSTTLLVDDFLPRYHFSEHHQVVLPVPPAEAYRAMRDLDISRSRIAALLLAVRGLPHFVTRKARPNVSLTMDRLPELGFVELAVEPPSEIVLGVVGKFWRPTSGILEIRPEEFISFDTPGYAKSVMNFHVSEVDEGSLLATETRILCTDETALRRFKAYWTVIGPFSALIRRQMLDLVARDARRLADRS